MKVLLVAHHLPPRHRAGVEVHTLRLAHALRDAGADVALYCTDDAPQLRPWDLHSEPLEGVECWRLAHPRIARNPTETLGGAPERAAFARVLEHVQPEVVHFQHLMYVGIGAPLQTRALGIPTVLTLHEYWMLCGRGGQMRRENGALCMVADAATCARCLESHRFGRSPLEAKVARWSQRLQALSGVDAFALLKRLREAPPRTTPAVAQGETAGLRMFVEERVERMSSALAGCAALLCPSRFLRDRFVEAFPEQAPRLHYWPNGVPFVAASTPQGPGRHEEADASAAPLRVGFVGSITPEKGVDVLVRASTALPKDLVRIRLHGDRHLRPRFSADLQRLGGTAVEWAGRFDGSSAAALAGMDVLVVPSVWFENAPLVISEAFAAGVPVVASDLGGMRELVQHEVNGLVFPVGDSGALAQCLGRLASDRTLLQRLAAGVRPPRSIAQEAEESLALYSKLRSD